jgi:Tfp pilus assembly protein PilF
MSFISDTLKKVTYDGGGGDTPPPGIYNKRPDDKSPLKYILLGALGFIAFIGVGGFFFSDQIVAFLHPAPPIAQSAPVEQQTTVAMIPSAAAVKDIPQATPGALPDSFAVTNQASVVPVEPVVETTVQTAPEAVSEPVKTVPAKPSTPSLPEGVPPEVVSYSPDLGMVMMVPDADSEIFKTNSLTARANNALRQGDNKNALKYFLEAFEYTQNSNIAYNVAFLYIQNKEPDIAVEWIKKPILEETDRRDLLIELVDKKYLKEAEACIKELVGADRYGNLVFASAYLNEVKGDFKQAAEEYRSAMVKSAYDPYITYSYARSQDMMKNYEEAILHYNSVAQMSQDMSLKQTAQMRMNVLIEMQRK